MPIRYKRVERRADAGHRGGTRASSLVSNADLAGGMQFRKKAMSHLPNHQAHRQGSAFPPNDQAVNRPANNARLATPSDVLGQTFTSGDNAQDFLGIGAELGAAPAAPMQVAQPFGMPEAGSSWLMSDVEAPLAALPSQFAAPNLGASTMEPLPSALAYQPDQQAPSYADQDEAEHNELELVDEQEAQAMDADLQLQEPDEPDEPAGAQESGAAEESDDLRDVIIEEPVVTSGAETSWSEPRKPARKVGKFAAMAGVFGIVAAVGVGGFVSMKGQRLFQSDMAALTPDQHPLPDRTPGKLPSAANAWERHKVNRDGSMGALVAAEPLAATKPAIQATTPNATSATLPPRDPFPAQGQLAANTEAPDEEEWLHGAQHRRQLEQVAPIEPSPSAPITVALPAVQDPWPVDDALPSEVTQILEVELEPEPMSETVLEPETLALEQDATPASVVNAEQSSAQVRDHAAAAADERSAIEEPLPVEVAGSDVALAPHEPAPEVLAEPTTESMVVAALEEMPPITPTASELDVGVAGTTVQPAHVDPNFVGPPTNSAATGVAEIARETADFGPPMPTEWPVVSLRPASGTSNTRVSRLSVEDVMLLNDNASTLVVTSAPNVWSAVTIPMHLLEGKLNVATPNVGKVRLTLQSGDSFEGRLTSIGAGQAFLETSVGRLGFPASSIQKLAAIESQDNPLANAVDAPEYVRIKGNKNNVAGRVVRRTASEVTFETAQGSRVTVGLEEVEPLVDAPAVEVRKP